MTVERVRPDHVEQHAQPERVGFAHHCIEGLHVAQGRVHLGALTS